MTGRYSWAKMSPEAAIFLELTRMDRLFNRFPVFDAAAGFTAEQELASETEDLASEKVGQPQPVAA